MMAMINTFEEFTHPDGVHLDPDTKYWIVISQTTPWMTAASASAC